MDQDPCICMFVCVGKIDIANVHTPNQADQLEEYKAKNSLHSAHMNKRTTR